MNTLSTIQATLRINSIPYVFPELVDYTSSNLTMRFTGMVVGGSNVISDKGNVTFVASSGDKPFSKYTDANNVSHYALYLTPGSKLVGNFNSPGLHSRSCFVCFNTVGTTQIVYKSNNAIIQLLNTNRIQFAFNGGAVTNTFPIVANTWYMLSYSVNATQLNTYINGTNITSGTRTGLVSVNSSIEIGATVTLSAQVNMFRAFDTFLSDSEMLALYNSDSQLF